MKFEKSFLLLFLALVACTSQNPVTVNEVRFTEQLKRDSNYKRVDTIFNNRLVTSWNEQILRSLEFQKNYSIQDTVVANVHYPNQDDTIRTFKNNTSQVVIYITPEKNLLLDTDLYDKSIAFSDEIEIGDSREHVADELGTSFSNDTLQIMEEDGYGIYFLLFFKDNVLNGIHYESIID